MSHSTSPIVYAVDDAPDMLAAMSNMLLSNEYVVRAYGCPQRFLDEFHDGDSSCIVSDFRMPEITGLDIQEILRGRNIETPLILVTGYGEVPAVIKAFQLGAFGVLEKPFRVEDLLALVDKAIEQDRNRRARRQRKANVDRAISILSERERQVMRLVAEGLASKQIANALGISQRTVEFHRGNIMAKLRVSSMAEVVRLWVLHQHLLCEPPSLRFDETRASRLRHESSTESH